MNEREYEKKEFVGYEYKEIKVNSDKASLFLDCYENFGWQQDDNFAMKQNMGNIVIRLKRNRKISNKSELIRLEKNFEACIQEIQSYETQKSSLPKIVAISLGIFGTAFIAGSVFAVTADPPIIWLCIILAIPGFFGWTFSKIVYDRLFRKEEKRIDPLILLKYDEIYEICQKGNILL